ncbi:Replication protein [Balamuthia mandrillaris]
MNIAGGMEEDEEEEEAEPTTLRRSPSGLLRAQGGKQRTFVFNPANGRIMQVSATAAPSKAEGGKEWQWFWEELPMKEEEYEATPTFAYCRTEAPTAEQRGSMCREGAGGGCWHHLFFRGSDGLLHELYSKSDGDKRNESKHQTWQHKVYTDLPPIRSGTSTLSCVPRSQQQDSSSSELFVFYLSDTNGHLLLLHKQLQQQGERWTYTCVNVSQRCGMKEMEEDIEGVAVKAQLYKGQIEAYFVELGSQSRLFRFTPLLSPLTKEQQGVNEMEEVKEEEKEQERDKIEFWHETMRWEVTDVFATFVRRKVRKSNRPASHRVRLRWRRRKRASRLPPPSASSYYSNMITITAPIEKEEKEVYEECAEITQVASVGCFVHDNITHVFYVGRDGHIFELYSRDGRRWRQLNLTEEASRSSSSKMMMEDDDSGDEEEEQVPKASALYPLCCAPDPHSGDTYITFVSDEEDYFTLHQLSWTKQTKRWVDAQIIDTCWQPFVSTPAINGSGFELQLPTSSFSPTSSGSFIKVRKKKNDGGEEGGEEREEEEEERKLPTVSTIGPSCFLFDEETAEISLPNVQWSTIGGKKEAEHQQEEGDDASFNEEDDDDDEGERFCAASSSSASVLSPSLRMTILMGFFEGPQQNLWVHSRPLQNPFAPSTISQVASFLAPEQEQLQQQEGSKAEEEKDSHDVGGYEEMKEASVTFSSLSPVSSCSSSSSSTSIAKRTDAGFLRRSYKQKKLMELIRFFNSGDLYWVEPKVTTKPTVGITSAKSSSSSSDEDDDEKHKTDSSTSFSSASSIPKEEKKEERRSDKLELSRIELHPAYFDSQTQSWRSLSSPAPSISSSSPYPSSWWQNEEEITRRQRQPQLKLLTYNILFHRTAGKVRHPELLKIVQKEEADVIAFQEVTKPFLQLVLEQSWVREGYAVSDGGGGETVEPYGVLMLSRIPFHRLCLHDLPTKLARRALIAELLLFRDNNSSSTYKLSVATAHFESYPEDEPIRKQQLELVFSLLRSDKEVSTSVLMGDFNFGDGKENENIPSEYVDLWPHLRPEEEGYTFNYRKNKLTSALRSYQVRRTDRILLSNHSSSQQQPPKWIASDIRMIGTEEIKASSNNDDNNNMEKEKEKEEEEEEKEEKEEEQQQEKEREEELSSSSCASSSGSLPMVRGRVVPFWPSDHFGVVAVLHACSSA